MATLAALTEDWSSVTLDATKWFNSSSGGGGYTLAGDGKLILSAPGGGAGFAGLRDVQYIGPTPYLLLDGTWLHEIITPPVHVDTGIDIAIYARDDGGITNWFWHAIQINDYSGVRKLNIQLSTVALGGGDVSVYRAAFDPTAHRHIGTTISADGVRWWASPDGVTWGLLHYEATLITGPIAVCNLFYINFFVAGVASDSATFGPVNIATAPVSVSSVTTAVVNYKGTWKEFPKIIITGPITNPIITNTETGEKLDFTGLTVDGGQTLTIDLTYGNKSAVLSGAGSALGYLSAASDLMSFHLAPAPEANGGVNHIALAGSSTYITTGITVKWYDRFVGI